MNPNILFVFSDQQRYDTLGCYGQQLNVTPVLDQLASEGVMMRNAFTCQPVCGPARACLQTGKYATEIGCYRNAIALPQDEKTLPKFLSSVGYDVGYVGKWHLASTSHESNEDIGPYLSYETTAIPKELRGGYKDYWVASDVLEFTSHGYGGYMYKDMEKVEFSHYRVDATTDYVLDYLEECDSQKPFFLFTSYIEPHHQNDHNTYEGPEGSKSKFKNFTPPGDLVNHVGEGDWEENYPDYLGCCHSIDSNLGRIIAKLKEKGIYDQTIIIYTSDHGSHFKLRNSEYKRSCHDACVRIPMIISGPGFNGGMVVDDLVSLIDLPKTILNMAGIKEDNELQGNDIGQLVSGDCQDWPREVFIQISESQVGRAIRTQKWKYSVSAPDKDGALDASSTVYYEEFLYDLERDPFEQVNLIREPEYELIREELRQRLIKRAAEANEGHIEIKQPVGYNE